MTWVEWLLVPVMLLYLVASANYLRLGQTGLSLAFLFYALSNGGLILAAIQGRGG